MNKDIDLPSDRGDSTVPYVRGPRTLRLQERVHAVANLLEYIAVRARLRDQTLPQKTSKVKSSTDRRVKGYLADSDPTLDHRLEVNIQVGPPIDRFPSVLGKLQYRRPVRATPEEVYHWHTTRRRSPDSNRGVALSCVLVLQVVLQRSGPVPVPNLLSAHTRGPGQPAGTSIMSTQFQLMQGMKWDGTGRPVGIETLKEMGWDRSDRMCWVGFKLGWVGLAGWIQDRDLQLNNTDPVLTGTLTIRSWCTRRPEFSES
ncbi:hypothetical protein K474DRAFT_1677266 [Panus rudis PR-1116 ss-1]|nr:hypothetical protein K474DRAFT_1677266 [Panus rudis PR-1116 ss-1]